MAVSRHGDGAGGGNPTRHSGRSFAFMDPERQREVITRAADQPQAVRLPPSRNAAAGRQGQQHDPGGNPRGSQGGGGR